MYFLLKSLSRLSNSKSHLIAQYSTVSIKTSTGLTGLQADPSSRKKLLNLYCDLENELKCQNIPENYVYKKEMLSLLENRKKLLEKLSYSDLELETIMEGQLEELVEQVQEELELVNKIVNEWKPWEKENK